MRCDPRIAVVPASVKHAGPEMTLLARMAGVELDEAQRYLAGVVSGVSPDGKWAAFEAVIMGPRQSLGKTEFMLVRILAGLYLFKEDLIVYSAHRASTTTKTFRRLKRAIDQNPALGLRIARVSNRVGQERIEFTNGQAVEMVARSTSSGRGFTGDCLLLDEAHELDADQLAAILPMLATRPNPQIVYALSMGNEQSSHLGGLRERALSDAAGVAWVEWSMADDDDPADRAVWARCNPALHTVPPRITMDYIEKEFLALGPDRFAQERLGRSAWPTGEDGEWATVSRATWEACYVEGVQMEEPSAPAAIAAPLPDDPGGALPWWHNSKLGRV